MTTTLAGCAPHPDAPTGGCPRRPTVPRADKWSQAALQAQAKVFIDLMLLALVVGCLFVIFPTQTNPAWVLIGLVVVAVIDFWVRYVVLTRAAAKATV